MRLSSPRFLAHGSEIRRGAASLRLLFPIQAGGANQTPLLYG